MGKALDLSLIWDAVSFPGQAVTTPIKEHSPMTIQATHKPGPKPITYIPLFFRSVPGVENVTTPRQLARLKDYMETDPYDRLPYVRLGSSVPQYDVETERQPSATYAVSVEGRIEVIRLMRDPRAAEKWVGNAGRPWNMAAAFAEQVAS
jgi:hypothetical protein